MAECGDDIVFQSSLDINKKPHQVQLTRRHLTWDVASPGKPSRKADSPSSQPFIGHSGCKHVPLKEVIAVNLERSLNKVTTPKSTKKSSSTPLKDSPIYIELQAIHPVSFSVHFVKRCPNHKWKKKKVTFFCQGENICRTWVDKIEEALSNPVLKRPRSLLVFINPFGGKRRAPRVYEESVAPLLDLAKIKTHVITTTHAGHAREVLEKYNLQSVDGVVCVGGDGMFTELLNGLVNRKMSEAGKTQTITEQPISPDLRIGIIPAGSTDAICYSTTGINDPVTSAIHIIVGDSTAIDVCSIYDGDQFLRYSSSMLAYGYYGDMLKDSENNRWMGPKRYQIAGAKKFLGNKSYEGEVSFKLASSTDSNPRDKITCNSGCNICAMSKNSQEEKGSEGWHTVRGKFLAVASFTMSCRCLISPLGPSPYCHLGDGTSDLLLIQQCSRVQFLRHLYRCSTTNGNQFDLPFIKIFRVREWSFSVPTTNDSESDTQSRSSTSSRASRASTQSVWNCDGEVVTSINLQIRTHCQLIKLFARGIEELEVNPSQCCTPCCDSCDPEDKYTSIGGHP
ncbi:ceramide kinase-like [Saccostrea cucullata]|uniref:ceramide kinase-like n=1 Tax=Saccostrea cuccullata TaxID=36930 RepID=UPI002ED2E305